MINFFRLSKYFLAYFVILILSAAITVSGLLLPIDLKVYKKFYLGAKIEKSISQIKDKIIFVNLPVNNDNGEFLSGEFLRGDVAHLLDTIGSLVDPDPEVKPPVVILDISFSNNPVKLDSIKDAIDRLKKRSIKVYGVYDILGAGDSFQSHDREQAGILYNRVLSGGRLNTKFNTYDEEGLLSYDSFELIGTEPIPSLAVKVVHDYSNRGEIDLTDSINFPFPIRLPYDQANFNDNFYEFSTDSLTTVTKKFTYHDTSINLSDKFVIIGLSDDIQDVDGNMVPGPFLVGSAIIDQLNGNEFTRSSHDDIVVQLAMVLLFALFVCLIFAFLYKYVKKLQTKPHFIALLAFIIGMLVLTGVGFAFLKYTVIRPALPTLSMVWASVLAWHFTRKFLVTGIMEGGEIYDVFISYSRGDSDFVKRDLYQPLSEFKKPDGSKLKIFFDEKSIGIGELFTSKYMRAIVDSKLFVPVISEEYYKKNHCRNEMDLAVKRKIEKLMSLCIIALDYKYVPEEFTNINFVDITKQKDFMTTLKKEIVKDDIELIDDPDTIEAVELDEKETKLSKKKKKVKSDKKDKKKDKKKKDKKSEKEDKKKSKKKDKKDKKKKSKKGSDKKDKKDKKKKSKKGSNKKDKKKKKNS